MIKTVQVEEKRCICDICNNKHYTMHGPTDTEREGWIHAQMQHIEIGTDIQMALPQSRVDLAMNRSFERSTKKK